MPLFLLIIFPFAFGQWAGEGGHFVLRHFARSSCEYKSAYMSCMLHGGRPSGVAWDAVSEQSWLIKLQHKALSFINHDFSGAASLGV